MALSPFQLKNPHRVYSKHGHTTYLERSFEERDAQETAEWWQSGIVEKLFSRARTHTGARSTARNFLKAVAQGLVQMPLNEAIPEWRRVVGLAEAAGVSVGEPMEDWSSRPDLLLMGLDYGYSPFVSSSWARQSAWKSVHRRVVDRKDLVEDIEFLQRTSDVALLRQLSPEVLRDVFDSLCWRPLDSDHAVLFA